MTQFPPYQKPTLHPCHPITYSAHTMTTTQPTSLWALTEEARHLALHRGPPPLSLRWPRLHRSPQTRDRNLPRSSD
jgi:hypothetical protein